MNISKLTRRFLTVLMAVVMAVGLVYAAPVTTEAAAQTISDYRTALGYLADGEDLQEAYDAIANGIKYSYETIDLESYGLTVAQLSTVSHAVVEDNPEYFWYDGSYSYYSPAGIVVKIIPTYNEFEGRTMEEAKTVFNGVVDYIVSTVSTTADDYTKEKAVHDYLINNVTYDINSANNQSAYSALVEGCSVCAGYAKAFKLLCNKLELDCLYVAGTGYQYSAPGVGSEESHAWNMVRLDGEYYCVDVTWDDLGDERQPSYSNFNVTSANFMPITAPSGSFVGTSHVPYSTNDSDLSKRRAYYGSLPTCTATADNYYVKNQGKVLYVADGGASALTNAQIENLLTNPVDGTCRIYLENLSDAQAVMKRLQDNTKIGAVLSDIKQGGTLPSENFSYGYSSLSSGHELQLSFSMTRRATLVGSIIYSGPATDELHVVIRKGSGTSGTIVYDKTVSGLGASYAAYCLEPGTYTICYSSPSSAVLTEEIVLTASETKTEMSSNLFRRDLTLEYDVVSSIEVTTLPIKVNYKEGDALDLTGGEITITYGNGVKGMIALNDTEVTVTGYDPAKTGIQTLTATYGGQSAAFTISVTDETAVFGTFSTVRSGEANRWLTAISNADYYCKAMGLETDANAVNTIIVACGGPKETDFADALAGSYLAARTSAPILIIGSDANTQGLSDVTDYIRENLKSGGTVYLLGGTAAIKASAETAIKQAVAGITAESNVKRLAGADRLLTNIEILNETTIPEGSELIIATGYNFADGLSASALGKPIMLVGKNSLTEAQKEFLSLNKSKFSKICILGGTNAVSANIANQLESITGLIPDRLAGGDRYETSYMVACKYFDTTANVTFASGAKFPDGLTGGPIAFALGGPMFLTISTNTSYAETYYEDSGARRAFVLGGTSALTDEAINRITSK